MAFNEEQREAAMQAMRLQQQAERERIDRANAWKRGPSRGQSTAYRRGFALGFIACAVVSALLARHYALSSFMLAVVMPSALAGGALAGWLAERRRRV
ncbi:hypothetical protein [Luteimonas sp. e5]